MALMHPGFAARTASRARAVDLVFVRDRGLGVRSREHPLGPVSRRPQGCA